MPFYVSTSHKRRTVAIKGASDVQFVICEAFGYIITIEAILNDDQNHRNVTFDWVQIRGTEVVLSHPNEPITTFEYTNTSDKIFRFYIDKDTARETYIDVKVYHTPISFFGSSADVSSHEGTSIVRIAARTDTSKAGYSRTVVTNVLGTPAVKFDLEYFIQPDISILVDKLELFFSPDARVAPYTLEETWVEPSSFPDTYVAIRGYYTWVLSVTYPTGHKAQYISNIQVSIPLPVAVGTDTRTIDDLVVFQPNVSLIDLTRFGFLINKVTIENEIGKMVTLVNTRSTERFSHISTSVIQEMTNHILIGYTTELVNITKLNPSGVGSPE